MIFLTKKNKERTTFLLNHQLIEKIDMGKDTLILLTTGKSIYVAETPEEVVEKIARFQAKAVAYAQRKEDVEEL